MKTASILLLLLTASVSTGAQAQEVADDSFERVSSNLIIDFLQTHDMLGPAHAVAIKIFGNGRVEVELPLVNPRAGNYEMTLEQPELDDLVASIIKGDQLPMPASTTDALSYISDSTRTNISLYVDSFVSSNGSSTSLSAPIEISESDLGLRSNSPSGRVTGRIPQLFSVEQQLLQLSNDTRLIRK